MDKLTIDVLETIKKLVSADIATVTDKLNGQQENFFGNEISTRPVAKRLDDLAEADYLTVSYWDQHRNTEIFGGNKQKGKKVYHYKRPSEFFQGEKLLKTHQIFLFNKNPESYDDCSIINNNLLKPNTLAISLPSIAPLQPYSLNITAKVQPIHILICRSDTPFTNLVNSNEVTQLFTEKINTLAKTYQNLFCLGVPSGAVSRIKEHNIKHPLSGRGQFLVTINDNKLYISHLDGSNPTTYAHGLKISNNEDTVVGNIQNENLPRLDREKTLIKEKSCSVFSTSFQINLRLS